MTQKAAMIYSTPQERARFLKLREMLQKQKENGRMPKIDMQRMVLAKAGEKSAQDIMEALRRAGSRIGDVGKNVGSRISDWYTGLDPEARGAVGRGLAGATIGGLLTGGIAKATPQDPESRHSVMGPALLGALLGGGAAAGLPYGLKLLRGSSRLPGEKKPGVVSQVGEMAATPFLKNWGVTAGLGTGLALRHGLAAGQGGELLRQAVTKIDASKKVPQSVTQAIRTAIQQRDLKGVKGIWGAVKGLPERGKHLMAAIEGAKGPHMAKAYPTLKALTNVAGKDRAAMIAAARRGGKGMIYGLPASLLAGWLLQRYIQGET